MSTNASKGIPQTQMLWIAMIFVILLILISTTCYIFSFITRWLYKRRILEEIRMLSEAQKNVQNVEMMTDLQSKLVSLVSQLQQSNSKDAARHTTILPQVTQSKEFSFAPLPSANVYRQQKHLPKMYQVDETAYREHPISTPAVRELKKQELALKTPPTPSESQKLHTAKRKKHKHKRKKKSKSKSGKRKKKGSESSMQTTQTSKTSVNTQTPPTTSTTSISHINTSQLPDRSRLYFDGSDEEELSDSYEEDEKDEDVYYDDSSDEEGFKPTQVHFSQPRRLPEFDPEDLLSNRAISSDPDEVDVEVIEDSSPPKQAIELSSPPNQAEETTKIVPQQTSAPIQKAPANALDEVTAEGSPPPDKSPPKNKDLESNKSQIECRPLPQSKNLPKNKLLENKPVPDTGFIKSPVEKTSERQIAGFAPDDSTSEKFLKKNPAEIDSSKQKTASSGRSNLPVSMNPYWRAETTCDTDYDHIYSPSTGRLKAIVTTAQEKTTWYPPNKPQNKQSSNQFGNPLIREQFLMPKKHTATFCQIER